MKPLPQTRLPSRLLSFPLLSSAHVPCSPFSSAPVFKSRAVHTACAAALATLCAGAQADDAAPAAGASTLDPMVVTGSRAASRSFDLPYSVDVVGRDQISDGQLRVNASEALAGVPGLVVLNRQNYAQDLQISARGFGARSAFGVRGIRLIADGIPATTPDGQGQAATFDLDIAERIEVLRGPFSTVYGNDAGGVIQLFSRTPTGPASVAGGVTAGSFNTWKADLQAEGAGSSFDYLLDASRFHTDGYRPHSAATRDQAYAKLDLKPDEASTLTLVANGMRQHDTQDPLGLTWTALQANPRSVDQSAVDFNTRKSIDHVQGGATYERRFDTDRLQLVAYSGQRSVVQYQAIPASVQANPRHSGGVIDFDRNFEGASARWIAARDIGAGALRLTAGLDFDRSQDDRRGYENFIGSTLGVEGALRRQETDTVSSFDPYLQADWRLGAWSLNAGLRQDTVKFDVADAYLANGDDSGSVSYRHTTGALGTSLQVNPGLNVYVGLANGIETPTLTELSYSSPTSGFNFSLKPALSQQIEVGLKALLGADTRANAALFQIRTRDEIVISASSGGRTSYQNAGKTLREGLELAIDSRFDPRLSTRASLTFIRAVYDENFTSKGSVVPSGNRLPGVPAVSAYAELLWKPMAGLSTAVEATGRAKMYVEDSNTAKPAPGYGLLNWRLSAEQSMGHWKISELLRIDNLFDRHYVGSVIVSDTNGRFYEPGPGAAAYAGVQVRYVF